MSARSRASAWGALVVLLAAELWLFDAYGSRRFTAIFPRWNDQIQYLGEAYAGHEHALSHGLAAGLWQTLVNPSAQGTLHDVAATLLFAVVGPSRSAALALNALALIAWQAALFFAVLRTTARPALAGAAAALPLALAGPWQDIPGSAYDFRLDHFALCALGVTSAAALLTDGFRSRRWSIVLGLAIAATLLTRFLTGTYFVVLFLGACAWCVPGPDRRRRLGHLALAGLVAATVAAPFFWLNREWVWNYYYIGHYVGPESAIRNQHFGLGQSVAFVAGQLGQRHLGPVFGALAVTGTVIWALVARRPRHAASATPDLRLHAWMIGLLFTLAPAIVLTLHQQKSEVVVGALAPGIVMLVIAAWHSAAGRMPGRAEPWVGAALAIGAGAFFIHHQVRPAIPAADYREYRQVNALADTIYRRSLAARLPETRVAVDYVTDAFDAQVLRVVCYERQRVWRPFNMTLPTGIAEPTEAEVMARLALSDFVFLTLGNSGGGYPFDRKLAALHPQIRAWCEQHLRPVGQFTYFGRTLALYQRPEIPVL